MLSAKWLVGTTRPARRLRLYCFAYAGGGAHAYALWQDGLPPDIEVRAIQMPGRGARMSEPAPARMLDLVQQLAAVLAEQDATPFAFFGHSLGALVAFELARLLAARGARGPERLIVSSCTPPQVRDASRQLHTLPDDAFLEALAAYEGTPPEVLAHRELMELVLPTLRADFALAERYVYWPGRPLQVPITVVNGAADPHVVLEDAMLWQRETSAECASVVFAGGHFYLQDQRDAVLALLVDLLVPGARRASPA
jgi:medium-chain acyl-[acyl-carrier-protein] hydrolase